jgi:rhamnulokinase
MADFFNFLFSGVPAVEESLASTTQLYNPRTRAWSASLAEAIGLPPRLLPKIVPSGTKLGPLSPEISKETGLQNVQVVATCSHDTGAAVAAVPAEPGDDWAYLSSGTWSLIGVELPEPLINDDVLAANFTNEGGYGGTTRFLKNLVGLWILQECRRDWERAGEVCDYAELNRLAAAAPPLAAHIDPDDARFLKPGGMLEKIAAYCTETGQTPPATQGAVTRCILESLALLYREQLAHIEILTGRNVNKLHIVGGGSQSELLNQFAANATGRTVIAGPVEATAIGNVLIQALAAGDLKSLTELRETVRTSFDVKHYAPADQSAWSSAFEQFKSRRKA